MFNKWTVVGACVAVAIVTAFFLFRTRESLHASAERVTECFLQGDVDCILSYVGEKEAAVHEANGSGLEAAAAELSGALKGWTKDGSAEASTILDGAAISYIQPIRNEAGERTVLTISLRRGTEKNEFDQFSRFAVSSILMHRWPMAEKPFPQGRPKLAFMGAELKRLLPELSGKGLKGIANYDRVHDNYEFQSLESFAADLANKGKPPNE